jgi:hypothetical protein
MTEIWEVVECEEYAWQVSRGLYSSLEAARQAYSAYTEEVYASEDGDFYIIAKPEYADAVREALRKRREERQHYWWYTLEGHGEVRQGDDGEYAPMFYGIQKREVK